MQYPVVEMRKISRVSVPFRFSNFYTTCNVIISLTNVTFACV